MNAKHTPGPWHLGKEGYYFQSVRDQNEHITADVNIVRSDGEGQANARLIAAAPDLLAALEAVTLAIEQLVDIRPGSPVAYSVRNARTAIAKAKGE